jgi:hypothetical protein
MTESRGIDEVLRGLSSGTETERREAAARAGFLLEKRAIRYRDQDSSREMFRDYLGEAYADVELTEAQVEAVTQALVGALRDVGDVAGTAAFGLRNTDGLAAVPALAEMLRRWAPVDGWTARQPIIALEDIITLKPPEEYRRTADEEAALKDALEAVRFAAEAAVEDDADTRNTARNALVHISRHLRRVHRRARPTA